MATTKTKRKSTLGSASVAKKSKAIEMMPVFKNSNEELAYKQMLFKKQKKAGILSIIGKMPEARELLDDLMAERRKRK